MNIKDQFEKNGYEIIGEYKGCEKPCLCVCKYCGKNNKVKLHTLKKLKVKCRYCYNLEIENFFRDHGCKLLSKPSRTKKMKYICSCGNKHSVLWFNFKNGTRCRRCLSEKLTNESTRKKEVATLIKEYFSSHGCTLLDEYKGQSYYLNFICSCGKKGKVRWKQFKKGSRCELCAKKKILGRHIPSGPDHFRWNPNREEVLLNKTVRSRIKKSLKRVLNEVKKNKIKKTFDHLGYSKIDLVNHIKNHPNWNDVKNKEWELDHVFPMKAFFDHKIYDEKIINCLENLQPLTKMQNRSKNDIYDQKKFIKFCISKGVSVNFSAT